VYSGVGASELPPPPQAARLAAKAIVASKDTGDLMAGSIVINKVRAWMVQE
jgi:hypothetical protein